MASRSSTLALVFDTLPLGGTSTFALNLCQGLSASAGWHGVAAAILKVSEIGAQMQHAGLEVLSIEPDAILHEERIESIHRQLAPLQPKAVVAALGSGSFDFVRYVPDGCLRIGMIQSDDAPVYDLVARYLPWLDLVVGVSREICRKMEARLGDRKIPVICQPYGVPMPPTAAVREPSDNGPLRVLYLGRMVEEQKRVGMMARIIHRTLQSGANIEWTIAGDGPDMESFSRSVSNSGDRVRLLGAVPYKDVPEVISTNDVYFLCSDYEGLPLSLLETMGAGLVPVVSDLPSGISEVVRDETGIRVAIDDEAGFAEALIGLAKDRGRLASLSRNASTEVREMTKRWETMLNLHGKLQSPDWSRPLRATAPMELAGDWKFSPLLRPLRRAMKRFRQRGQA
jgi:glycosyltransferase involved in cell wall biosynthesis